MEKLQYIYLRNVIMGLLLLGGLMSATQPQAASVNKTSNAKAVISIPVALINIQATCDLTFTGLNGSAGKYSYTLDALNLGQLRQHTPFKAEINCRNVMGNEGISTALTASVRKGTVTDNRIRMLVDGKENVNGPELWLEAGGQRVPLNGSTAFCKGSGLNRNECTLTPVTQVPGNAPSGQVSATVVFDVTYV